MLISEENEIHDEIRVLMNKSDIISTEDLEKIRELVEKLPEEIQAEYGEIFSLIGDGIIL